MDNRIEIGQEELKRLMLTEDVNKGFMTQKIKNRSRKEKYKKKEKLYQSRPRRSRFGELIQIDGSYHDWFEGRAAKCCLLIFIDDATSRLIALRFVENETTLDYMHLIYEHIKGYGKPLSYYILLSLHFEKP